MGTSYKVRIEATMIWTQAEPLSNVDISDMFETIHNYYPESEIYTDKTTGNKMHTLTYEGEIHCSYSTTINDIAQQALESISQQITDSDGKIHIEVSWLNLEDWTESAEVESA